MPLPPTWSWASVVGGITFAVNNLKSWRYDLVEIVNVNIKPMVRNNQFGSVLEGRLKIRGTLKSQNLISRLGNIYVLSTSPNYARNR